MQFYVSGFPALDCKSSPICTTRQPRKGRMTRTVDQVLFGVDLTGKICVITGATSGLGLMTAQGLASAGATVVLAGRDPERLRSAGDAITTEAAVETVELELDSLASVRSAAVEISARFPRVDVLINNAGVMFTPYQQT